MTKPQRLTTLTVFALIALYGALVAYPVFAQTGTAVLSCTPPTKFTDGTNIPAGTVISYKFYHGTTQQNQAEFSTAPSCAYTWGNLPVGTHWFSVTATVSGVESVKSAPVSKTIAPPTPNPPSGLTVQQDLTAYIINQSDNRLVMVPAGTVPAGTVCDTTQQAMGKYVVNIATVAWAGTVRARVAFATCS